MAQRKKPPVGTAPPPVTPPAPPAEPERIPLADIAAFPGNPTLHTGISIRHYYIAQALKATDAGKSAQERAKAAIELADAVLEILDPSGPGVQEPTVAPRQEGAAPPPVAGPSGY